MDDVHPASLPRTGDGYLAALGYLQIGAGAFTILMSLMALAPGLLGNAELFDPVKVFGQSTGFFGRAIAAYVSLQLGFGWLAGVLQLAAGICCLHGRRPGLVGTASVVSLLNFPHGTMAAILMLHGLRHEAVAEAFHRGAEAEQ